MKDGVKIEINAQWLRFVLLAILAMWLIGTFVTDDSDKSFWVRSGFVIKTDYKTDMQYLCSAWGNCIPRMDTDGKQMWLHRWNDE